jgi:hypothetical protein
MRSVNKGFQRGPPPTLQVVEDFPVQTSGQLFNDFSMGHQEFGSEIMGLILNDSAAWFGI